VKRQRFVTVNGLIIQELLSVTRFCPLHNSVVSKLLQAEGLLEPKPFTHKQLLYPNWSTYCYDWSQL